MTQPGSFPAEQIFVEESSFFSLSHFLDGEAYKNSAKFILCDTNTAAACLPVIEKAIPDLKSGIIIIPAGEENKNIESAGVIWNALTDAGADRKSVLICLGGGMITDIGGFAASVYKRGTTFLHIPTTLLGMVDAAIGGKTGIDFNRLKNHIGTFSLPAAIFIYPGFLNTLNERIKRSGIAEMIKHAVLADRLLFDMMASADENYFYAPEAISQSIAIKLKIVSEDPLEMHKRKLLNFGHTIGHAVESFSLMHDSDPVLHGEAVAMGMICETFISVSKKKLDETICQEIVNLICKYFKKIPVYENQFDGLIKLMMQDKKNKNGMINFSLPEKKGSATFDNFAGAEEIKKALYSYRAL